MQSSKAAFIAVCEQAGNLMPLNLRLPGIEVCALYANCAIVADDLMHASVCLKGEFRPV